MTTPFMESPRFPVDISYGVRFGPEFITEIAPSRSGREQRNRVRTRALCSGDCAKTIQTAAQLATLITFFRSVGGRWLGWRFKDWSDYQLAVADSLFTLVAGTVNQYQLNKLYKAAVSYQEIRKLQKPVSGTFALFDTAVSVAAGAGAGQYAIDTTTGIITLVASQANAISSHTIGAAHVFVLTGAFSPQPTVGQYVAASGVTGTAAATLNGLRHVITNVSGTSITVSTVTTGLTASGGTLSLYRQEANLTASCEFDVPCRFETDRLAAGIENFGSYSWQQVPIMEIIP